MGCRFPPCILIVPILSRVVCWFPPLLSLCPRTRAERERIGRFLVTVFPSFVVPPPATSARPLASILSCDLCSSAGVQCSLSPCLSFLLSLALPPSLLSPSRLPRFKPRGHNPSSHASSKIMINCLMDANEDPGPRLDTRHDTAGDHIHIYRYCVQKTHIHMPYR